MLRIALVLCVVASSLGSMVPEAMIKKYSYMKAMKSCVGEETVKKWMMNMKAAIAACKEEPVGDIDMSSFDDFLSDITRGPNIIPVPFQHGMVHPRHPGGLDRMKRFINTDKAEEMKEEMKTKLSNITCALRKLEYINEDKTPNYGKFKEEIEAMEITETLKKDFLMAVDMCQKFSQCLPVERVKHPFMQEMGTTMGFMKCCGMKRMTMCMREDFRKYASESGYEGDVEELINLMMVNVPEDVEGLFESLSM
ncbi:uncharacterized protein LOC119581975 [Penaeus monodon]|uniref:uncharacterized protein LOC119581975 n=1 Tax=Penaeus monodon TaxID=6687 RepID=UPI0018A7A0E0|nr:uncharacterized protein LOC119581975 [Penaeus monodon]